jgi:hypothetical protein
MLTATNIENLKCLTAYIDKLIEGDDTDKMREIATTFMGFIIPDGKCSNDHEEFFDDKSDNEIRRFVVGMRRIAAAKLSQPTIH